MTTKRLLVLANSIKVENFSLDTNTAEVDDGAPSKEMSSGEVVDCDEKKAKSSSSHLSITLPCEAFRNASARYNITVVFMEDITSMTRCFLGILTPRLDAHQDCTTQNGNDTTTDDTFSTTARQKKIPCGRILRVDDDVLCQMLLGP